MQTLSFSIHCNPPRVTKQMKKTIFRGGKVIHIDTPELNEASALYMGLLLPHRPSRPLEGPLTLSVHWCFPHNQSASKAMAAKCVWKDTAPDLDNMEKLLVDTMAKMGFFSNDGQIAEKTTRKMYDPGFQGLLISLSEMTQLVF